MSNGHEYRREGGQIDARQEIGGGQLTGNSHRDAAQLLGGQALAGDDHRPVVQPHGSAAGGDPVAVGHGRIRGGGYLQHVELAVERASIQRLNVGLHHFAHARLWRGHAHAALRDGEEHEGVVGVGAVGDP